LHTALYTSEEQAMFGKSSLGAGWLVTLSCIGTLVTACLDRPLCGDCHPETTNQFVVRVPTAGVDKIDLLFMIDNSGSMADKQKLLSAAVPSLLSRFVSPLCLDDNGQPNGNHFTDGRCATGAPEFAPIGDIHIGVITSSLGIPGGTGKICNRFDNQKPTTADDRAWLLPKARMDATLPSWNSSGFLAWDPSGTKNMPPGTRTAEELKNDFQDLVSKTGETGCGFEASLESWYRFLVDPEPPANISVKTGTVYSQADGIDQELLTQREHFLRPDSLVAILMLTDENDCSLQVGGPSAIFEATLPRATAACATNPDDPCCRSCLSGETSPPSGCKSIAEDESCKKSTYYAQTEDPTNLHCFDQKRRYGLDFLEPTERYIQGLTSAEVRNRAGELKPNPLFRRPGKPDRDLKRVFLAGIVGVPWQDIATDASRSGTGLRYLTAAELRDKQRWDLILGDPKTRKPPTDPHMIESIAPRSGQNPLLAPEGTIAPPTSNSPKADVVNGHEQTVTSDLQYACIFELETPVDCNEAGKTSTNCDCKDPSTNSPLCQPPGGGAPATKQFYAKAYPGTRHLEVLKGIGDQAVVASICPKIVHSNSPADDPNYGYNPAVSAIVDTLRPALANQCLSRAPLVDDGKTACAVLETRFSNDCDCTKPGRAKPNEDAVNSVRDSLKIEKQCGVEGTPTCESLCACEIVEAQKADLTACRSNTPPDTQSPGYCYVDPDKGLGDPALVRNCPSTQKRLLRFVGPETPRTGSLTFMACMGAASAPQ
jgi:hypothetical protein